MNRIKRNGYQKILSLTLSASLLLGLTGCGAQKAEETAATASEEEALLTEALSSQGAPSHSAETGKEETVYVLADASGGVEKIIVSDWLKNKDGDSTLQDASDLQNIENVKGYETFVSDGKYGLTWQADGADIYYQGSTEKQLPVAVKLTYKLDGKEVKPEEIAGKSGRVTIRMDYENKETRTVEVNGRKEEIHIPFAMLSGMLLPQDTFSNIEVTNGRLLSEGNNSIVVGIAFPGLKESLNWEELKKDLSKAEKKKAEEELAIPDYLEVSADAENFSLGMTMTIAMSDMLSDFSLTDSLDLEEMNDSMNDLQSASNELKDGTSDLKDGSAKLKEGTDSLADGVVSLKDGAGSLKEVMALLNGEAEIVPAVPGAAEPFEVAAGRYEEDFADVKGQALAKRALEIAAAGGHNVLMIGAPGSGKTMLARRMPTILPPLSPGEALETTKIHSVAGKAGVAGGLMARRPYRAPHHTISQVALIGGGQSPRPGEVSLAHNGVLFLDELPEFGRSVLEVLRQPLEEKKITVSRAKYSVEYPANFTLVAAMNPCPCGYYNHPARECVCSPGSVHRYMSRISGPLMDRIDMHVEVTPVSAAELSAAAPGESSAAIRARVVRAREVQAARFRCAQGVHTNAMMNAAMLREYCRPDAASAALLERAMERLNLSARAYDRILKVARTIADLAGRDTVAAADVAEAINYRSLDRGNWGR